MKDRKLYLKQIPITPEVYEQLQELWSYNLLDYCNHTPCQAIQAARQLNLLRASNWIESHQSDYVFGQYHQQWRLAGEFTGNVICRRLAGNSGLQELTNVPRSVAHHSPNGHSWGYLGSGCADFALDILNWFVPPNEENGSVECWVGIASRKAWQLHQTFKQDVIALLPQAGATISKMQILDWIAFRKDSDYGIVDRDEAPFRSQNRKNTN